MINEIQGRDVDEAENIGCLSICCSCCGDLSVCAAGYCWPASNERLTETKQCSAYSRNEGSSQNKNVYEELQFLGVCVSLCVLL